MKVNIFKIGILLVCFMAISPIFFISADTTATSVDVFSVPAPSTITATVVSYSEINLSWDAVTNAVSYNIYKNSVYLANTTSATYADTNLSPSTAYTYQVASIDSNGIASALSDSVTATTMAMPVSSTGGAQMGGQPVMYVSKPSTTTSKPILINNGANLADNKQVLLYLSAKGADQMMLSNNPSFTGATWEEYKTVRIWTLSDTGEQKVYAKFKNSKGAISNVFMDMIFVNQKIDSATLQNLTDKLNAIKDALIGIKNQTPTTPQEKAIEQTINQTKKQESEFQNQVEQEDVPLVKEKTEDIIKQTQPQEFNFDKMGIGGVIAILFTVSLIMFLIKIRKP